jgi:hypothetical protein
MGGIMKPQGVFRVLLSTAALGGGLFAVAPHAEAATVDIIVDSTAVTLSAGDSGTHVGKLTLANISDKVITLTAAIPGDGGCDIKPEPTALDPGRRTVVTLTFSAGCDVAHGADVTLSFGPQVRPSSYVIKVETATVTAPVWSILPWAFASALLLTLLLLLTAVRWSIRGLRKERITWPGWSEEIAGLSTDWSFKDNWAGNITIGSTVLIGLFAASNILEAILGAKPEAALGLLAVAGGIASLLVGLGPLVIKGIGKDLQKPTVGGAVLAAGITLVGVLGQSAAAAIQAWKLTSQVVPRVLIVALTALVATFVFKYAIASINDWIEKAAKPPSEKESPQVEAARIVAKAIAIGTHTDVAHVGPDGAEPGLVGGEEAEPELPPPVPQVRRNALL